VFTIGLQPAAGFPAVICGERRVVLLRIKEGSGVFVPAGDERKGDVPPEFNATKINRLH
jgi:hypothetical protein